MKNLLVAYYSQTGQLKEIVTHFVKQWSEFYTIDFTEIKSDQYHFPMTYKQFFDVFPETVLKQPCKIHFEIEKEDYDTVILGFQPWFLYPSRPFNSFLQSEALKKAIRNKPVILVIDARNSWRNSLNEVIIEIEKHGGIIKGIFVFREISKNRTGFISLCYWLFTGKKKSPFKLLPAAGISQEIIDKADIYGVEALKALTEPERIYTVIPPVNKEFTSIGYERYAVNKYLEWAEYISKNNYKHRRSKLLFFRIWILITLFVLSPLIAKKNRKTN
ncbi:MAG: hypothetical protein LBP63_07440 [Prevotellaceae bacterium]|jgi:flavodoxin|nr:hypothetical protein [Prevotellaceae bacterium]